MATPARSWGELESTAADMGWTTAEEFTEEKFEQFMGKLDLRYLLQETNMAGTLARIVNAIPSDARLLGSSFAASYIEHRADIPKGLKLLAVSLLRALPQAIPLMFGGTSPKLDEAERVIEQQRQLVKADLDRRRGWVGPKRTDLIHDEAVHPSADDQVVNRGEVVGILNRFSYNPLCPDCFGQELSRGQLNTPPPAPPPSPPPNPMAALASFSDRNKANWVADLFAAIRREQLADTGQGLSGRAFRLGQLLATAVAENPEQVESLVPENPPDVSIAAVPQVQLDQIPEVERFFAAIEMLGVYQNPSQVAGALDSWDKFWERMPAGSRPFGEWLRGQVGARNFRQFWRGFLVFVGVAAVGLAVLVGSALVFGAITLLGIAWSSIMMILIGTGAGAGLSYVARAYDVPLNLGVAIVNFLDPTDGEGIIGASVKAFFDSFKPPERVKEARGDREPIAYFTDRAVSVVIVWAMIGAIGCYVATLRNPVAATPAAALMAAGMLWILAAFETVRKAWRRKNKHGAERLITEDSRAKMAWGGMTTFMVLGVASFILGAGMAATLGMAGSSQLLQISQRSGQLALEEIVDHHELSKDPVSQACYQKRHEAEQMATKAGHPGYCQRNANEWPCDCSQPRSSR